MEYRGVGIAGRLRGVMNESRSPEPPDRDRWGERSRVGERTGRRREETMSEGGGGGGGGDADGEEKEE